MARPFGRMNACLAGLAGAEEDAEIARIKKEMQDRIEQVKAKAAERIAMRAEEIKRMVARCAGAPKLAARAPDGATICFKYQGGKLVQDYVVAQPNYGKAAKGATGMRSRIPTPILEPGTIMSKDYKGARYEVKVLGPERYEYQGAVYRSPSAIASAITGTSTNGWKWFGYRGKEKTQLLGLW